MIYIYVCNYFVLIYSIKKINDTDQLIAVKKLGNARLDKKIQHLNLDITELNLSRDLFFEEREAQRKRER